MEDDIPIELQKLIDRELEPRERVVWKGRPKPTLFNRVSLSMFLFAIPWTLFSGLFSLTLIFRVIDGSGFYISRIEEFSPLEVFGFRRRVENRVRFGSLCLERLKERA